MSPGFPSERIRNQKSMAVANYLGELAIRIREGMSELTRIAPSFFMNRTR